jgi:pimeloyl-ACP methyl ester carboxylesterase
MSYPAALHVISRPASVPGSGTVVFVHGSLDRAESFQRVMRRLPELDTVAYDRRGYQQSRAGGVVDLGGHVDDLLRIMEQVRTDGGPDAGPVVALGHSLGGDVVLAAALAEPGAFDAVGAYEPPMPWLGFRRAAMGPEGSGPAPGSGSGATPPAAPRPWPLLADDPGDEAEAFFCRMVSAAAWARLTDEGRAARRADGPALVADMRSLRSEGPPFDVTALTVPVVFGMGGPATAPHHRRGVQWLAANVPGADLYEMEGALHGAHLSHPDHFADMARLVVERGLLGA